MNIKSSLCLYLLACKQHSHLWKNLSIPTGVGTVSLLANPDIFPLHSDTALHVNLTNVNNLGVKLAVESSMGTLASSKIFILKAGKKEPLQKIRRGNLKWCKQLTGLTRTDFWFPGSTPQDIFPLCLK